MMYLVYISYVHWLDQTLFVTQDKQLAEMYVEKFNKFLTKWKLHYSQYVDEDGCWFDDEKFDSKYYNRFSQLFNINKCCFKQIELR